MTPVVAFPSSLTCQPLAACCPVVKQTKVDSLLPLLLLEPTSQIAGAGKAEIRLRIVFTRLWWGLSFCISFYVLLSDIFASGEGVLCRFADVKSYLICFTCKQDVAAYICICMEAEFLSTVDLNESPMDLDLDVNCAGWKNPSSPLFLPPPLGLISSRVVQIWYCSLDIRHTVGELADTQPATNPTSRCFTTGFQLQHIIKLATSTFVTNTHNCVFQTLFLMPPLPSHHSKASRSHCPFLWPHTWSIQPHLIISFFCCLIATAACSAKCLFDGIFYWWVPTNRSNISHSWRSLILRLLDDFKHNIKWRAWIDFFFSTPLEKQRLF